MFNKTKRIFALMLVFVMVLALAGCSKPTGDGSSADIEYVEDIEYVYESGEDGSGDNTTNNVSVNKKPTENKNNNNNNNNSNTSKGDDEPITDPSQTGEERFDNDLNPLVDVEKYKGKTIVWAVTQLSEKDEGGKVVDAFEKKYGITVKEVMSQGSMYSNWVASKIATGDGPDVFRANGDFPTCMNCLQSLTAAKLWYDDPAWDQDVFNFSTFNGEPYLCNILSGISVERDIIVYNKSLLSRAGVSTPTEYYKAGKWDWDAFETIIKAVAEIDGGGKYYGAHFEIDALLASTGSALYKYENGKFLNGMDASYVEKMQRIATWRKNGWLTDSANNHFRDNKVGMAVAVAWQLKKDGQLKNMDPNNVGYCYVPAYKAGDKTYSSGMVKAYGIARGSKEPVAAGLFLRYYLDTNNYKNSSNVFITPDAEKFFFEVTSDRTRQYIPWLTYSTFNDAVAGFEDYNATRITYKDPSQVPVEIEAIQGEVDKAVDNFNKHVQQNIGKK